MNIEEIQCKSILTKSKLPESDYCINPYVGCSHNCCYCYARFMRRFTSHTEEWGQFVDVKINAKDVLEKQMSHHPKRGIILLGSVTDAYQPLERKYGLTRSILEVLLRHDFPISILSKSNLVLRDIDLLRQFRDCEIGLTITTLDDKVARKIEPFASSPSHRLEALGKLHETGIKTYAFIGPILPTFTDAGKIFEAIAGKTDFIMAEVLNTRCGNRDRIFRVIKEHYPDSLPLFKAGLSKSSSAEIENEIKQLSQRFNIPLKGFYKH